MEESNSGLNAFSIYIKNISNIDCYLTPKQELICQLICCGMKVPEIAKKLCKSSHTIETHIQHIKAKTKLCSITALVCWYSSKQYQKIAESSYMQAVKSDL
jgi:DNA-binding NarL/FixJ family response regulator